MELSDIKLIHRAAEFLINGIDIEKLTVEDFNKFVSDKTKQLIKTAPSNIFTIKPEDDACDLLSIIPDFYIVRNNSQVFVSSYNKLEDNEKEHIEMLSRENVLDIMAILYKIGITAFVGIDKKIYDKEYIERVRIAKESYNILNVEHCSMMDVLTKDKTRTNYNVMLSLCKYPNTVYSNMMTAFDKDWTDNLHEIKELEQCSVIDNRIYIPISEYHIELLRDKFGEDSLNELETMKYIVVSKNPYDFFFASYGSNIQSCYSISSTYLGWYGFLQYVSCKGLYIVYGTNGKDNSQSIISGKKWSVPQMSFRCWGWLSEDNHLLCDRIYKPGTISDRHRDTIGEWLDNWFTIPFRTRADQYTDLKYADEYYRAFIENPIRMYPDSVYFIRNKSDGFKFRICHGNRGDVGTIMAPFKSLLDELKAVESISPNFKGGSDSKIVNGVLSSPNYCPITGLSIPDTDSVSFYAKFFEEPLPHKKLIVITYDDGFFKFDTMSYDNNKINNDSVEISKDSLSLSCKDKNKYIFTKNFSVTKAPLKTFKENLKGLVKHTGYDCIILRCVEQDKVTFIKYKG